MERKWSRREVLQTLGASAASLFLSKDSHRETAVKTRKKEEAESLEEYGKRICDAFGEGEYVYGDFTVGCHFSGGYTVKETVLGEDGYPVKLETHDFDFPEQEIDLERLVQYAKEKKIMIFGEEHHEFTVPDGERLNAIIPFLAKLGFTHIYLEIDVRNQSIIDEYIATGDKDKLYLLPFEVNDIEEYKTIIDRAIIHNLTVQCIDDFENDGNTEKSLYTRDLAMATRLERDIIREGNRAIVYVGLDHAKGSKEAQTQKPLLKVQEYINLILLNHCIDS